MDDDGNSGGVGIGGRETGGWNRVALLEERRTAVALVLTRFYTYKMFFLTDPNSQIDWIGESRIIDLSNA